MASHFTRNKLGNGFLRIFSCADLISGLPWTLVIKVPLPMSSPFDAQTMGGYTVKTSLTGRREDSCL